MVLDAEEPFRLDALVLKEETEESSPPVPVAGWGHVGQLMAVDAGYSWDRRVRHTTIFAGQGPSGNARKGRPAPEAGFPKILLATRERAL
jgi:hypothetical protein